MKKVLITGGAGFVGFNLCKKLIDLDYEVTVVDNFSRPNDDEDFKYVKNHENVNFIIICLSQCFILNSIDSINLLEDKEKNMSLNRIC